MGVPEVVATVVSTKGQVILPKSIRDRRKWTQGTRLTVEDTPDGVILKAVPLFPQTEIDAVFGSMKHPGPALSLDDMDVAVAREAKSRARG